MQWMGWTREALYNADNEDFIALVDLYNEAHRQQ